MGLGIPQVWPPIAKIRLSVGSRGMLCVQRICVIGLEAAAVETRDAAEWPKIFSYSFVVFIFFRTTVLASQEPWLYSCSSGDSSGVHWYSFLTLW